MEAGGSQGTPAQGDIGPRKSCKIPLRDPRAQAVIQHPPQARATGQGLSGAT